MTGLDDARGLFEDRGLGFPTIPDPLAEQLAKRSEWCFATRELDLWPYEFESYVKEAAAASLADYAVVAHAGHGSNSWAIHYYLVHGSVRLFLQLGWGGVYMDHEKATREVRACFARADQLIAAARVSDQLRAGEWLTVAASDFYGSDWWRPGHAPSEQPRDVAEVLDEALRWLTREGGSRSRQRAYTPPVAAAMTAPAPPAPATLEALQRPRGPKRWLANIDPNTAHLREHAASVVADQCGVRDLTPYVVIREIDGVIGSMHQWNEGTPRPTAPLDAEKLQRMRAFDFVIGNRDRHSEIVLWEGGAPVLVDHGFSFPSGPPDRFVQPVVAPPGAMGDEVLALIAAIDEYGLADTLRACDLDEVAIRHTAYRLRLLKGDPQLLRATDDSRDDDRRWDHAATHAHQLLSDDDRAVVDAMVRSVMEATP